ncbi:MAG: CocE/NonD family hydrolase [Armatimonadetes bacterium]|nr:CocE/NonD family hydrolase [Armatimonadota bacterium]
MRDGVELAASITRPDAEGKFPAIMEYTPYHAQGASGPGGRYRHFAERGYVCLNYDVRGTGNSRGITTDMYSAEEIQDGCDMVEWIAAQPWCNGKVGMWGISYGGVVCWQVAMHAPPHLAAVIIRSGTEDVYTEWTYPGGCPRPYIYENYATLMTAYNFAPPSVEVCGEKWAEIWNEHLQNNVPWGLGYLSHQVDGPYWRDRSARPDYDRIECAVFVIGGWADWYPTPLLRGFSHLKVPKRALIGPWSHYWPEDAIPGPRIDGVREYEKWFDHWLKGIDTGVLEEPPVTVFVREYSKPSVMYVEDAGFWRAEHDWPLDRTQNTDFFLRSEGRLGEQSSSEENLASDDYPYDPTVGLTTGKHGGGAFPPWGMPLDQRLDETRSLVYSSDPLERDLEVIGNPKAVLHVASTAQVAYFHGKVCDVAPDGTSKLVTRGGMNATHRASRSQPEFLAPGRIYELEIPMLSVAYKFRAGHRIRVSIASADFQNAWPVSESGVNSVYRCSRHPSRVVLPVTPVPSPGHPEPDVQPCPHPLPARETIPKPDYAITHDLVNQTVTMSYTCRIGAGINQSSFTVSATKPAEAVVKSSYDYTIARPDSVIKVDTHCVTASDEATFRHLVEVEISVNGRQHFNKSWAVSIPREFN